MGEGTKKLLFFVTEDWYFCSHRMALAVAAKQSGDYDVTVVTRVNQHADKILEQGFKLIPLDIDRGGVNPFQEFKTLVSLWRIYRQVQPDIIHHIALKPVLYGGLITLFNRKIKVVNLVAGLGAIFSSQKTKARLLRPWVKQLLRVLFNRPLTKVIVQNSDDRQLLINQLKLAADKIALIQGSGVDIQQFCVKLEPCGIVSVALVSRLLWDKGIAEFVDAVKILKQKGLEFNALLVGSPDNENMASVSQSQLDDWQAEGVIQCLGYVSDIAKFWQENHLAVLPSYREGLPRSLLEAAASGRAIITTDTAGCNAVVEDGVNGILVPVKDTQALADAIETLIINPELRVKMGLEGRKRVEEYFSDEIVIVQTLDVYRQIW